MEERGVFNINEVNTIVQYFPAGQDVCSSDKDVM